MTDKTEVNLPIPQSRSTAGLERMSALPEYASELLKRLRKAMEAEPRHSADARVVSLVDLCGAIQLIQAGAANLRDVERLDWYTSQWPAGTLLHQAIQHTVAGSGVGARAALDDAMMRSNV